MLQKAEAQAGGLERLSGELETRADALKPIERQLAHFEGLLAQWESAQARGRPRRWSRRWPGRARSRRSRRR